LNAIPFAISWKLIVSLLYKALLKDFYSFEGAMRLNSQTIVLTLDFDTTPVSSKVRQIPASSSANLHLAAFGTFCGLL